MKNVIRSIILVFTLFGLLLTLAIWSASDDTVESVFAVLGAFLVAAFITGFLAMFAHWLSKPDTENKNGDNSVDEKASGDLESDTGIDRDPRHQPGSGR